MPVGKVKSWNDDKGFGFIAADDGSGDIFLHVTALEDADIDDEVLVGLALSYEVGENPRSGRTKAINVRRCDERR
jgi:CspA family cold shock protein